MIRLRLPTAQFFGCFTLCIDWKSCHNFKLFPCYINNTYQNDEREIGLNSMNDLKLWCCCYRFCLVMVEWYWLRDDVKIVKILDMATSVLGWLWIFQTHNYDWILMCGQANPWNHTKMNRTNKIKRIHLAAFTTGDYTWHFTFNWKCQHWNITEYKVKMYTCHNQCREKRNTELIRCVVENPARGTIHFIISESIVLFEVDACSVLVCMLHEWNKIRIFCSIFTKRQTIRAGAVRWLNCACAWVNWRSSF